jgi:hypothetical protein
MDGIIGALALALVVALTINWFKDAVSAKPLQTPQAAVAIPAHPPSG